MYSIICLICNLCILCILYTAFYSSIYTHFETRCETTIRTTNWSTQSAAITANNPYLSRVLIKNINKNSSKLGFCHQAIMQLYGHIVVKFCTLYQVHKYQNINAIYFQSADFQTCLTKCDLWSPAFNILVVHKEKLF